MTTKKINSPIAIIRRQSKNGFYLYFNSIAMETMNLKGREDLFFSLNKDHRNEKVFYLEFKTPSFKNQYYWVNNVNRNIAYISKFVLENINFVVYNTNNYIFEISKIEGKNDKFKLILKEIKDTKNTFKQTKNNKKEIKKKKINNGISITSVSSINPCYIGNGQIVYRNWNDGGKLYIKSATEIGNGIAITSVSSISPCHVGNDQIVYANVDDERKLYLKSATGTDNGTAINSINSYCPCYIGNRQIIYRNNNDGKLYLKSDTGTDNWTAITSVSSWFPCYIGNGQIVYQNISDGCKLYLKSSTGTDNGTAITSASSWFPCYIGNGQIVYTNFDDGFKLYLKNINEHGNGTAITSVNSAYPCYIGNSQIVYQNNSDGGKLYLLDLKELDLDLKFNDQEEAFNGIFEEKKVKIKKQINKEKLLKHDFNEIIEKYMIEFYEKLNEHEKTGFYNKNNFIGYFGNLYDFDEFHVLTFEQIRFFVDHEDFKVGQFFDWMDQYFDSELKENLQIDVFYEKYIKNTPEEYKEKQIKEIEELKVKSLLTKKYFTNYLKEYAKENKIIIKKENFLNKIIKKIWKKRK